MRTRGIWSLHFNKGPHNPGVGGVDDISRNTDHCLLLHLPLVHSDGAHLMSYTVLLALNSHFLWVKRVSIGYSCGKMCMFTVTFSRWGWLFKYSKLWEVNSVRVCVFVFAGMHAMMGGWVGTSDITSYFHRKPASNKIKHLVFANADIMVSGIFFSSVHLFIHEKHRERGRDIGRGKSRLPAGSLMWDPRDHNLSQRQMLTHWATQVPWDFFFFKEGYH